MKQVILILSVLMVSSFLVSLVYAQEDTESKISITITGEPVIYLDLTNRMIRATVVIENFNPSDGFYTMKVIQLSTQKVLSEQQIFVTEKTGVWGTDVAYILQDDKLGDDKVGKYELFVETEFGSSIGIAGFSIVQKDISELGEEPQTESSESKIPEWIDIVFQSYLEGIISEDELIAALQFLISKGIIVVT